MSKLVESFARDALERIKTPEVQATLYESLLAPLLALVWKALAPYIIAIGVLWLLMGVGIGILVVRMQKG